MIIWRVFKDTREVFSIAQILIDDWKRATPSAAELDGFPLMFAMNLVDEEAYNKHPGLFRLERVEVPWDNVPVPDEIIRKPSRQERRAVEKRTLKEWKKQNKQFKSQIEDLELPPPQCENVNDILYN